MPGNSRPGQSNQPPRSRLRVLEETPRGLRVRIRAGWGRRALGLLAVLAVWSGPAWLTYQALAPTLSAEALGILLTVLWGLPALLAGLAARLLHRHRDLAVRAGELEIDTYVGGRHTRDRYRFERLEVADRRAVCVVLHPGPVTLQLGQGLDAESGDWLSERMVQYARHSGKEAAPSGTASVPVLRSG